MHDWTLLSILLDWPNARLTLSLIAPDRESVSIVAHGFIEMHVTQRNDWGESVSVNRLGELMPLGEGRHMLDIEMQSGDSIRVSASCFDLPRIQTSE